MNYLYDCVNLWITGGVGIHFYTMLFFYDFLKITTK